MGSKCCYFLNSGKPFPRFSQVYVWFSQTIVKILRKNVFFRGGYCYWNISNEDEKPLSFSRPPIQSSIPPVYAREEFNFLHFRFWYLLTICFTFEIFYPIHVATLSSVHNYYQYFLPTSIFIFHQKKIWKKKSNVLYI